MENIEYKHQDYNVRSKDPYAMAKYQIILKWLPKKSGLRVLNAGCGSGEMSALLASNPTWVVDAIDIDEEAIEQSNKLKEELGLKNVNVYHTSVENHEPEVPYDIIISTDVLEHIEHPQVTVERMRSMITSNGLLCVTVPAMQWLFGYHDDMLGHYRRYSKNLIREHLSPYFEVDQSRYFAMGLIPIAILYSKLLRKSYPVGQQGETSLAGRILASVLNFERHVAFPIGTSVIVSAFPKEQQR